MSASCQKRTSGQTWAGAVAGRVIILAVLLTSVLQGKSNMPSKIDLYQIGVWFCVGFFTGAGWAIAAWLVGRIFSHI
jgi:hypothetical protein